MSALRAAISDLHAVLQEERGAIRELDGERILALAERKESLLAVLRDARASADPQGLAELHALALDLRQNCLLLAHARACIDGAVTVLRNQAGLTGTKGARLRVVG